MSKKIRNLGLRILPSDIVDEAIDKCAETRRAKVAEDPDAASRRIADAFSALGVMPDDLKAYLGHEIAQSSPAEIDELKQIYSAIRDGEATWIAALSLKRTERGESEAKVDPTADRLKARLAKSAARDTRPAADAGAK